MGQCVSLGCALGNTPAIDGLVLSLVSPNLVQSLVLSLVVGLLSYGIVEWEIYPHVPWGALYPKGIIPSQHILS
jgi:hypothetical protein